MSRRCPPKKVVRNNEFARALHSLVCAHLSRLLRPIRRDKHSFFLCTLAPHPLDFVQPLLFRPEVEVFQQLASCKVLPVAATLLDAVTQGSTILQHAHQNRRDQRVGHRNSAVPDGEVALVGRSANHVDPPQDKQPLLVSREQADVKIDAGLKQRRVSGAVHLFNQSCLQFAQVAKPDSVLVATFLRHDWALRIDQRLPIRHLIGHSRLCHFFTLLSISVSLSFTFLLHFALYLCFTFFHFYASLCSRFSSVLPPSFKKWLLPYLYHANTTPLGMCFSL